MPLVQVRFSSKLTGDPQHPIVSLLTPQLKRIVSKELSTAGGYLEPDDISVWISPWEWPEQKGYDLEVVVIASITPARLAIHEPASTNIARAVKKLLPPGTKAYCWTIMVPGQFVDIST